MHRLRSVTYLKGAELKGISSEDRVEVALIRLRKHGLIYRYYRSVAFGDLDSLGVDFIVWSTFKNHHLLQVKSSEEGRAYHKIKHGDGIPCVVADKSLSTVDVARKILQELELSTSIFEKLVENMQFT